jgi:hypothetical protein
MFLHMARAAAPFIQRSCSADHSLKEETPERGKGIEI